MSDASKSLAQMKKATKLANRAMHKNGPKSYKKGQGALIKVLHKGGGSATSSELVDKLSFSRGALKDVVRKAKRNGYVIVESKEGTKGYSVRITDAGEELAEKRCAAHQKTIESIMENLSDEEIAQLNPITEKIILSCKEQGAHGKRKCTKRHKRHCRK